MAAIFTGDPLHSRALAHSRAPLFTQPCPHCSHSRAPGGQWARLCVFTLQGRVQAARLCRGSPVIFKCIFLNENVWNSLKISLKFVPKVRINNIPALVLIVAWRRPGDKPLSEPMMVNLPTHICATRPRVNSSPPLAKMGLTSLVILSTIFLTENIFITVIRFSDWADLPFCCTVQCRYNAVNFLRYSQQTTRSSPVRRSYGESFVSASPARIYVLLRPLQWGLHYLVLLDRIVTALHCGVPL